MRDIFIKQLVECAAKDPSIVLITGDLGFGVLNEYRERFPSQFINAGLTESHMAGMAAGMAKEGKKVFTYSIGNFVSLRALEQLRIDVAYHNMNVTAVCIGGGFSYGQLGMTHHATEDLATMRAMPGMQVFAPCTDTEVREVTKHLAAGAGPAYLRLDKNSAPETGNAPFSIGSMRTVREGKDLSILATGGILAEAMSAAEALAREGIESTVLSVHSLRPFDDEGVIEAARRGGIVTVEEHVAEGGLGGAVAETCLERGIVPKFFYRVGMRDGFATIVGSQPYLRSIYNMDSSAIAKKVKELVGRQGRR